MDILHFLFLSEFWFKIAIVFFIGGIIYGIWFIRRFGYHFERYKKITKALAVLYMGLIVPFLIVMFTLLIRLVNYLTSFVW